LLTGSGAADPAKAMVDAAVAQDASDNVTAVAVEVTGVPDGDC